MPTFTIGFIDANGHERVAYIEADDMGHAVELCDCLKKSGCVDGEVWQITTHRTTPKRLN